MADVTVLAAGAVANARSIRNIVFINERIGYAFVVNGDVDLDYVKTTNGGLTWGAAVDVFTGNMLALGVWYDQWTPGNTGRDIHIWLIENVGHDVLYFRFNTVNDTKTAAITVFNGASAAVGRGVFVSGARMRGGNLLCCFNIDDGTETGTYKSVDNGATWSAVTNALEANLDQTFIFPANVADANDGWFLYDDDSAAELTLKEYDDSGNSYTESSALTFTNNDTSATGQYGFSGSVRHSDGHLIVAFFNAFDAAGEDFLVYDMNSTASLTALTALTTDIDDMYYPSVYLNQDQPDWIYVAYIGKSDGSETLLTTASVYYALSKDRGITWTKDIAYSTSSTDYRQTWTPLNGERFLVVWMDISSLALMTNYDNSKEFGYTALNNYQFPRGVGQNNTGIISVAGKG